MLCFVLQMLLLRIWFINYIPPFLTGEVMRITDITNWGISSYVRPKFSETKNWAPKILNIYFTVKKMACISLEQVVTRVTKYPKST